MSFFIMIFLIIWSIVMIIFSRSEKDYQKCLANHGKEFADKRRKKLKIFSPIVLVLSSLSLIVDIFFV